jgi:hypothetical protein
MCPALAARLAWIAARNGALLEGRDFSPLPL